MAGEDRWTAIEDIGRLRDGLGVPVPVGTPDAFLELPEDPLGDLVSRYARSHGPFTTAEVATRLGLGEAVARQTLQRLAHRGRVLDGEFRPSGSGTEWCDAEVLRKLRRRSLARLRQEIEPVTHDAVARFLPGLAEGRRQRCAASTASIAAIDQLAGCPVPASALEPLVLAARVRDYEPSMLDELTASGEVIWAGHAPLPGSDGWVSLHLADQAHLTLPEVEADEPTGLQRAVLDAARARRRLVLPPARRPGRLHQRRRAQHAPCGSWSGAASSPTTPSPRCAPWSAAARPRTAPVVRRPGWAARPAAGCPCAPVRPRPPDAGRSCPSATATRPAAPTPAPSTCSSGTAW